MDVLLAMFQRASNFIVTGVGSVGIFRLKRSSGNRLFGQATFRSDFFQNSLSSSRSMPPKNKKIYTFKGVLENQPGKWGFSYVTVPYDVELEFGTKASVRIIGTVNGVAMDRALKPMGDGSHYIVINADLRRQAGLRTGNEAVISFVRNEEPDVLEIPEELEAGFQIEPGSKELFEAHMPGVKRGVVYWINSAKTPATREKRAVEMLRRIVSGTLTAPKKPRP